MRTADAVADARWFNRDKFDGVLGRWLAEPSMRGPKSLVPRSRRQTGPSQASEARSEV
jgi:hypothetical protein